jgi:tRNA (cmo5U34)-methyltransferase
MTVNTPVNLWSNEEHATDYIDRSDKVPHRSEGEATLLEFIPPRARRVLDLGTGFGRLMGLVKEALAGKGTVVAGVAIDFSPVMLQAARKRFPEDSSVTVVAHNLDNPLPALGKFDAVVSSFVIHHLVHERKRALYADVYAVLNPGGVFCNLEHVASPTQRLHEEFMRCLGKTVETEDPSNKLLDMETQLRWLREIGFADVDCHWKWRELALMVGRKS